jgi:predicted nucleotidyltransferase component of viral defense system
MNLFDQLVTEALKNQRELSTLRTVVEKELLHHDILRILSQNHLLADLTFIGGTALRSCYGGIRLSEDLDFTGGRHFSRDSLSSMSHILIENLNKKYGLRVMVSEPVKDTKNVDTWKISIETRQQQKHLPTQRIHIDICALPSYEKKPMMLLNPYGVDMGTNGLILQVQSREEIFTDKLVAFAFRPNRIKNRYLWDIIWMHQQGLTPNFALIPLKLRDRQLTAEDFMTRFHQRVGLLSDEDNCLLAFKKEMHRFLPLKKINDSIEQPHFWSFLRGLMQTLGAQVKHALQG